MTARKKKHTHKAMQNHAKRKDSGVPKHSEVRPAPEFMKNHTDAIEQPTIEQEKSPLLPLEELRP